MPVPPELTDVTGFDRLYGLELLSASPEEVIAEVEIGPEHLQPFGLVHGGLYASMAESITSIGTYLGVKDEGGAAMGLSNQTSFLRPAFEGTRVRATARRRHRGRTTWIWEVDVTDGDGKLCALVRMTIAVRPGERPPE